MPEPLKILHVISGIDPRHGGPSTALLSLMRAQRSAGLDPSLVATFTARDDIQLESVLKAEGFDIKLIGPAHPLLSYSRAIKPALLQLMPRVDVVHIHAVWEQIQHSAAKLARQLGKPYLIRPCGMLDPWSLKQGAIKKKLYLALRLKHDLNHATAIHYTDQVERETVAPLHIKAPAIIESNIVDMTEFRELPQAGAFRARYPQLAGKRFALFLGRVNAKKGLDLLIPAFARVARDTDATLVIAGPDPEGYRSVVDALIRSHNLGSRVMFTGMLRGQERVEALVDSEFFVLTSHQENFGIAVVEALAAGKPVVISDHVAIHRHVSANKLGAVVPLDVDAIARELARWLTHASLQDGLCTRARKFVEDNYEGSRIAARWMEHYRRLLSKP